MALDLGIIGLPKSGKTTLFNAITGSHAQTSAYASGDEPNVAVVKVPDPRLDVLTDMFHPRKTTPADVKFTDVVGMSGKADDKKEPISRQTLGFLGGVDALVLVVRAFANPNGPLLEEGNPIRFQGLSDDDEKAIRNYGFLTAKPLLIVANLGEEALDSSPA